MGKNGLFLMSISLLIFLYAMNQMTRHYDYLSLITAVFFFGLGLFFVLKDQKNNKLKSNKKEQKKENEK